MLLHLNEIDHAHVSQFDRQIVDLELSTGQRVKGFIVVGDYGEIYLYDSDITRISIADILVSFILCFTLLTLTGLLIWFLG